jgi:uncharacterized protein
MADENAFDDSLCCYCTMCCNGSLFSHAQLDDAERTRLGDTVFYEDVKGSPCLQFPCTQLGKNGACQVYEARPAVCQSFRCMLLRSHERGGINLEQAKQIVDDARHLKATAREAIDIAAAQHPTIRKESRISRAMRALDHEHALEESGISNFTYTRAKTHFRLYRRFIRDYFSSKYS